MATPNYGYEKRQRELAKKKKKEEKLRSKTADRRPDNSGYAQQPDSQATQVQERNDMSAGTDSATVPSNPQDQPG